MALTLKRNLLQLEEFWIVMLALLAAWFLAAHQGASFTPFGVIGNYLYWTFRILIETAFFFAALLAVEKYFRHLLPTWGCYCTAILLSLIPFTLAITALDLIIGLPELGLNSDNPEPRSRGLVFGLELLYLLDNHVILSMLLLVPRVLLHESNQHINPPEGDSGKVPTRQLTFFDSLDPPLDGRVCSMEAQEHYILIKTTQGDRMVLHRFSDAVKQTPSKLGMQVHRSHWVAHSAIKDVVTEGQSLKLRMTDDKEIPVSRTFRAAVEKSLKH